MASPVNSVQLSNRPAAAFLSALSKTFGPVRRSKRQQQQKRQCSNAPPLESQSRSLPFATGLEAYAGAIPAVTSMMNIFRILGKTDFAMPPSCLPLSYAPAIVHCLCALHANLIFSTNSRFFSSHFDSDPLAKDEIVECGNWQSYALGRTNLLKLVPRAVPAYHLNRKPSIALFTSPDILVSQLILCHQTALEYSYCRGRHFLDSDHGVLIQYYFQAALPSFLILYRLFDAQRLQTNPRSESRHVQSRVLVPRKRYPCHRLPL